MADRLDDIRADHVARYRFASGKVRGSVLDAGCGCGYGTSILAGVADQVRAVDRSEEAVRYAIEHWQRKNIVFRQADVLCRFGAMFDWAVAFEIVEHVEDASRFLKNLRSHAARLLISAPNEDGIPFNPVKFPFHVRHYREREMIAALAEAGWSVTGIWHQFGKVSPVEIGGATKARTLVYEAS